jgi:hypothetical protein
MKLFSILLLSFSLFQAQAQNDIGAATGKWQGSIEVPSQSIQVTFQISKKGKKLKATMDSPNQGVKDLPLDDVKYKDNQLTMTLNQIQANYKGTLKNGVIEGTWTLSGKSFPLKLEKMKP